MQKCEHTKADSIVVVKTIIGFDYVEREELVML